jgi:DNA-binding XRE family transcriptional regulator
MTDHSGREPKQTTKRAQAAAAADAKLSRSTGFKPRPRLTRDQTGLSSDARLVHRVRVSRHWTQERLGAELGVTGATISRWEADLIHPPTLYVATMTALLSAA